jgi:hypothetical protein
MSDEMVMRVVRHTKHSPSRDTPEWAEDNRQRARRFRASQTPQQRRTLDRDEVIRLRTRALMLYGGCCAVCAINDSRVLQFDHIHGGGVAQRKLHPQRWKESFYRHILRNPSKFQVLCANHNWIKRWECDEQHPRKDVG